jgi:hypothetical protein
MMTPEDSVTIADVARAARQAADRDQEVSSGDPVVQVEVVGRGSAQFVEPKRMGM